MRRLCTARGVMQVRKQDYLTALYSVLHTRRQLPPADRGLMDYNDFIAARAQITDGGGFAPIVMPEHLFDFQRWLVEFAVRRGRAALFADCGMGKTAMELAWADNVYRKTGKPVLILTPLAVGAQFVSDANKFGHDAAQSRDGAIRAPIVITNYQKLHLFNSGDFGGVVCDESSILKSFDGSTKAAVTEFMRRIEYRLLGTATAAPNDYTELGTSSEALGNLGYMDMLTKFFVNKDRSISSRGRTAFAKHDEPGTGGAVTWRLKAHAETHFWRWVASWSRAIRSPADYGFDASRYILPKLVQRTHVVRAPISRSGMLFDDLPAIGLAEQREEARLSLRRRCEKAAELLADADSAVAWCHLNDESATLAEMIDDATELSGSDSDEKKEEILAAFAAGQIRVLVTKPVIASWGLNWQHAHHTTYFPSHSFEQMYQAIRRMWRFGQKHDVTVDFVSTEGLSRVLANMKEKSEQADKMFEMVVAHMKDAIEHDRTDHYSIPMRLPTWA